MREAMHIHEVPFLGKQLIAFRNRGFIDPEEILSAMDRGAYEALKKAVTGMTPEDMVTEVLRSGLRGRGGGGFPTGLKWRRCVAAATERGETPCVVCNGDDGDPGAFIGRAIIETDPHAVLEGLIVGGYAVGAREGHVFIRKEYTLAVQRLNRAIGQARELGLLGESVMGSAFSFDIHVHRGAGAFVSGESTACLASMAGRVGEPRSKYVHTAESGYKNKPTVLNSVETWAVIPEILRKGSSWFASIGTGTPESIAADPWSGSTGTKVFSLVGNVVNAGLVEVPMGTSLRELVEQVGGGVPNGRTLKAVQTGGPSGGCVPAALLDLPADFDSLTEVGSMIGSGGMIVLDDRTCMVDLALHFTRFLADESCGKCTPCREGLVAMAETLYRICSGQGRNDDLPFLEEISATMSETSLCKLGANAPNPVLSTLRHFREEYEQHIKHGRCPAGVCKPLISYRINEACTGCALCLEKCPVQAVTGERERLHVIDSSKCNRCHICVEVCRDAAVEVGSP